MAEKLADQTDYQSVYGEGPAFLHLPDGRRAEFAREEAENLESNWRWWVSRGLQAEDAMPLCPGCAVTVAFNIMSHWVQTQGMDHVEVADAMIRLFTEMKENGPFYTERSGIVRSEG